MAPSIWVIWGEFNKETLFKGMSRVVGGKLQGIDMQFFGVC